MWGVTLISLAGNVLNVLKIKQCFVIWGIANTIWLIYDISIGLYSRAFLDLIQQIFAIWGYKEWNNEKTLY